MAVQMGGLDHPLGASGLSESSQYSLKRAITRSRQGCLVCRGRRIKCDLVRPECNRCIKYGALCEWPMQARAKGRSQPSLVPPPITSPADQRPTSGVQSQTEALDYPNKAHGPPVVGISHVPTTTPPVASRPLAGFGSPNSLAVLDDIERLLALCKDTRMSSFFAAPPPAPDFLRAICPFEQDLQCFHHCITYSLYILVISEEHNPWIEHVARRFLVNDSNSVESNALKHSMLCVGAVHLSYLQARDGAPETGTLTRAAALRYRSTAIQLLRNLLAAPTPLGAVFFAAASLLLAADLLAAQPRWRPVMRLVRKGIKREGGCARLIFRDGFVDPAMKCAVDSLVFLSTAAALSSGEYHHVLGARDLGDNDDSWWEALGAAEQSQHELPCFEAHVGLTREVFKIYALAVAAIPMCGQASTAASSLSVKLLIDLNHLMSTSRLEKMSSRLRAGTLAFWHAANILLRTNTGASPSDHDEEIKTSATRIMEQCELVGDKIEFLNWPIIIACRSIVDPRLRDAARDQLKSYVTQCCYEIEVVQAVCEEAWVRLDNQDDPESCSWSEILVDLGCSVIVG